jgi:putative oxidoreductase
MLKLMMDRSDSSTAVANHNMGLTSGKNPFSARRFRQDHKHRSSVMNAVVQYLALASGINSGVSMILPSKHQDLVRLFIRVMLALVFLFSGATKLLGWQGGLREVMALELPLPTLALAGIIALQLGCGFALVLGWRTELAAASLAAFTILATLIAHPFWRIGAPDALRQATIALEHLAIVGGLLLLAQVGPGRWALGRSGQ